MNNSNSARERQLIDLSDDQLLDRIGTLWESIKRLEEAMGSDSEIQALQDQITQIKHDRYLDTRKTYKAQLRAARVLAQAKGLELRLPGEEK